MTRQPRPKSDTDLSWVEFELLIKYKVQDYLDSRRVEPAVPLTVCAEACRPLYTREHHRSLLKEKGYKQIPTMPTTRRWLLDC
jgi:hypothetical protein